MKLLFANRKIDAVKFWSFSSTLNLITNNRGVIPLPVIIALGVLALLGTTGLVGFLLGTKFSFAIGIAVGIGLLIALLNIPRIISWSKSVKKEVEK